VSWAHFDSGHLVESVPVGLAVVCFVVCNAAGTKTEIMKFDTRSEMADLRVHLAATISFQVAPEALSLLHRCERQNEW
jgi:hypothetical protein